jgi:hypothetical protein
MLMNRSWQVRHSIAFTVAVALVGGTGMASAQTPGLPAGANTTDPSAPFYIDLSGLDFTTTPPTRNPANPKYPSAVELPDGTLPAGRAGQLHHRPHSQAGSGNSGAERTEGEGLYVHDDLRAESDLQPRICQSREHI